MLYFTRIAAVWNLEPIHAGDTIANGIILERRSNIVRILIKL
jgi:hypothetical protein